MTTKIILPKFAEFVVNKLNEEGYEAFIVGGCVRDALLGMKPHDWDICTGATPQTVFNLFAQKRFPGGYTTSVIKTGMQHGTVTVVVKTPEERQQYEVTTFRKDGTYSDGRHPDQVEFIPSVEEDLRRRDFTVNAMAYHPETGLIDAHGGLQDLENKVLRCVGDPDDRFSEDPLRILRAMRFAATYGLEVTQETSDSMFEHLQLLTEHVAVERVREELCKMLIGKDFGKVAEQFSRVLKVCVPEIGPSIGFDQHSPWHPYTVWKHTLVAVDAAPQDLIIRLALFYHDVGKPYTFVYDENHVGHFHGHPNMSARFAEQSMKTLKFDNETIRIVHDLVLWHDVRIEPTKRSVRRLLNKAGEEQFFRLMAVREADIKAQTPSTQAERLEKVKKLRQTAREILADRECFTLKNLAINGRDLIAMGMAPGPEIGKVLNWCLENVLEDPSLNTQEALIELVGKEWMPQ